MMKKLYTLTLIALFSCISFSQIMAQCTPPSPIQVPAANIFTFNNWSKATFSGTAGHDYLVFYADTARSYIFSTHLAQECLVMNIPNNDLQITIQDSLGNPIGGKYGQSFQDDYDAGASVYEPFFAWAPTYSGNYRMVLTKYQAGSCVELSPGDSVIMYYSSFKAGGKYAVFHEIEDNDWNKNTNWMHYTGSGTPQNGKPADLKEYFVMMNGRRTSTTTLSTSDSCKALCLEDFSVEVEIPANTHFEVFDTIWNEGIIKGDGDLVLHKSFDFTYGVSVKEVVLKGDAAGSKIIISQFIGNPYNLDTLTIDNEHGVGVAGDFRVKWLKFKNGKVNMEQSSIPFYVYVLYVLDGHEGASSQSYVVNSFSTTPITLFPSSVKWLTHAYASGYTIPVGNETRYRPIKIDLSFSDSIGVNVFYGDSSYTRMHQDSSLSEVSSLEFWDIQIDETYASTYGIPPTATVSLSWDGQSGVNNTELIDLRVACNDTNYTKWLNRGQTAISSNGPTGWISSIPSAIEKTYTLAAVNESHALPIENLQLYADPSSEGIKLSWSLDEALQGDFRVERSADGTLFESTYAFSSPLEIIDGNWVDNQPHQGINYYRIQHRDLQGAFHYSPVVQEVWQEDNLKLVVLSQQNNQLDIAYRLPLSAPGRLQIIDLSGRVLYQESISPQLNSRSIVLDNWAAGMYYLKLQQGGREIVRRFRL